MAGKKGIESFGTALFFTAYRSETIVAKIDELLELYCIGEKAKEEKAKKEKAKEKQESKTSQGGVVKPAMNSVAMNPQREALEKALNGKNLSEILAPSNEAVIPSAKPKNKLTLEGFCDTKEEKSKALVEDIQAQAALVHRVLLAFYNVKQGYEDGNDSKTAFELLDAMQSRYEPVAYAKHVVAIFAASREAADYHRRVQLLDRLLDNRNEQMIQKVREFYSEVEEAYDSRIFDRRFSAASTAKHQAKGSLKRYRKARRNYDKQEMKKRFKVD